MWLCYKETLTGYETSMFLSWEGEGTQGDEIGLKHMFTYSSKALTLKSMEGMVKNPDTGTYP